MNRLNNRLRFLFLMLPAVFGLVGCSTEQTRTTPSPETVQNVAVLAVQKANVPDLLEAVGTVRAAQTSDAASQMMGNIVQIQAHEGDHVHAVRCSL
jgi:multidrug efflux pump subunit AcrA (membrane-fusion protein)